MMVRTDIFFNFMMASYDQLKERDGITLKEAWNLYKDYCQEAGFERKMNMHSFRDELRNYFEEFHDRIRIGDMFLRSVFRGFRADKLTFLFEPDAEVPSVVMEYTVSLLDDMLAEQPAQ